MIQPLIGGISVSVPQIVGNRPREQPRLLLYVGHAAPQIVLRHLAHVHAIEGDFSPIGVMEPQCEHGDRRFARARATDDRRGLARLAGEADMSQRVLLRVRETECHIAERQHLAVRERNAAAHIHRRARLRVGDLRTVSSTSRTRSQHSSALGKVMITICAIIR